MADLLFDFDEARNYIKEGARKYFTSLRAKHPEENFYVFGAVGCDDDPKLVYFTANTEKHFEEAAAKYRANTERVKSDEERGFRHQVLYYRWGFPEWKYQGGEPDVEPFYELVEAAEDEDEEFVNPGPEVDVDIRSQAYAAIVLGLRDLDAEGFFGRGEEREKLTLHFSLGDSEETGWIENEAASLLNPPSVYQRFYAEWLPSMATEETLASSREHPSSVRKAFTALIAEYS